MKRLILVVLAAMALAIPNMRQANAQMGVPNFDCVVKDTNVATSCISLFQTTNVAKLPLAGDQVQLAFSGEIRSFWANKLLETKILNVSSKGCSTHEQRLFDCFIDGVLIDSSTGSDVFTPNKFDVSFRIQTTDGSAKETTVTITLPGPTTNGTTTPPTTTTTTTTGAPAGPTTEGQQVAETTNTNPQIDMTATEPKEQEEGPAKTSGGGGCALGNMAGVNLGAIAMLAGLAGLISSRRKK